MTILRTRPGILRGIGPGFILFPETLWTGFLSPSPVSDTRQQRLVEGRRTGLAGRLPSDRGRASTGSLGLLDSDASSNVVVMRRYASRQFLLTHYYFL
jgi:hypothetical protein